MNPLTCGMEFTDRHQGLMLAGCLVMFLVYSSLEVML